jgi:protein-disulfide isomerase
VIAAVVFIGLAVSAAFGVAALVRHSVDPGVTLSGGATSAATPSLAAEEGTPSLDPEALTVPTIADASGGILVNLDGTVGGSPPEGAVRVDIYADLMCPVCDQFGTINDATLAQLPAEGTIAVYYHPVAILDRASSGTRYSTRAASALITVAQYDPAHFEPFFTALFDNQPRENSKGLSDAKIAEIANDVGVPLGVTARFKFGDFEQWVTDATDAASVDGLQGTPWVRAEHTAEVDGGIWSNTASLRIVLQHIHDYGLQACLDSVVAAAA